MDADDWLALGRHRWRRGARADGWHALRNATAFARGEAAATAGLLLTRRLVRRGSISGADRLLGWLEAHTRDDIRISLARARLLEWRRRDPQRALAVVEDARRRMPEEAASMDTRHARLLRKVDSRRDARVGVDRAVQLDATVLFDDKLMNTGAQP